MSAAKQPDRLVRRSVLGCSLVLIAALVIAVVPAWAWVGEREGETDAPTIEGVSVTDITETGATIEVQIDPQDRETSYEIKLVWQQTEPPIKGEPVSGGDQPQSGTLPAGAGIKTVKLQAVGLHRGYYYWYKVIANSSAGRAKDGPAMFGFWTTGAFPEGSGPGAPYETEVPWWVTKVNEAESARTIREYEEHQRDAAKQAEEKKAKEAAERAAEAAALRRQMLKRAKLSLKTIPQHNKMLGDRGAGVRLVVFSDPQSPFSRLWQVRVLPSLVKKYVRPGRLQVEWRAFTVLGSASLAGEDFIAAAGRQNRLWDVLDDVMANQREEGTGWLNRSLLETIGSAIPGFDVTKALSDAGSSSVAKEVASDEGMGQKHGLVGVPFFLVGRRDKPLKSLEFNDYTPIAFERPINRLLRER